ncbi:hypothetical protein D3C78_1670830 [compost metagenome]
MKINAQPKQKHALKRARHVLNATKSPVRNATKKRLFSPPRKIRKRLMPRWPAFVRKKRPPQRLWLSLPVRNLTTVK